MDTKSMNERIKELAVQAGAGEWGDSVVPAMMNIEKFAELIVKDCADMVKDAHKSGGGTYLHVLYERYGIEYPWVK